MMVPPQQQQKCLWKHTSTTTSLESYEAIYQRAAKKPAKRKSYFYLCANTIVIIQQISLAIWFCGRHRLVTIGNNNNNNNKAVQEEDILFLDYSNYWLFLALVLSVFFNVRSDPRQNRRAKAVHRTSDGLLLGVLLRFLAAVLQSLTESYSSDTVNALVATLMVLHVVFCDYSYANGRESTRPLRRTGHRPPFLGGTMSLNAALFGTTLLVSRLQDNMTSYLFVSISVIVFGFYPLTRHSIAVQFPASTSAPLWCITACVVASTVCLLWILDPWYVNVYLSGVVALGMVLPGWKHILQYQKVLIQGPWEIPTAASMQLDWGEQNCL